MNITDIITARSNAAASYPEELVDSMGRAHRCIPREAILRGDWDGGSLVRGELAKVKEVGE